MRPAPIDIPFDPDSILCHASGYLFVDKPAGVIAHASESEDIGLAESIRNWVSLNPGVVAIAAGRSLHPLTLLEREASGVFILALNRKAARRYRELEKDVRRTQLAIVAGPLDERGEITAKVRSRAGGRGRWLPASLEYERIRGDERLSLVRVVAFENRAHQTRALFASAGRPLAGDARFGKLAPARKFAERFGVAGPLLHVARVELPRGLIGDEAVIDAPVPAAFRVVLEAKGWDDALEPPG